MATILERWGTISWAQALEPAARIAEEGFVVTEHMALRWPQKAKYPEACSWWDYVHATPEAQRIYLKPNGSTYGMGERLRNPDYANTLRHLGQHGPEDFYTGELAQRMMADLSANGSYVDHRRHGRLQITGGDSRHWHLSWVRHRQHNSAQMVDRR